ncbi:hypothetical protein [Microbacterium album]|uniref:Alpha/beta hydrolase n=1 Tax=Microbacterium album TaxID=2053191 RepID=A0A917IG27_9MICO|nr:hypothetical protein [Microbacterium album]GGH42811.1 hypothetical protein GCM10010921_16260 [Microbacterium album]
MSLEIASGGAVAVDPQSLRDAAARLAGIAERFDTVATAGWAAVGVAVLDAPLARDAAAHAAELAVQVRRVADELRLAADVYDAVETRARLAVLVAGGTGAPARAEEARALEQRLAAIAARSPAAIAESDRLWRRWETGWDDELARQATLGGLPVAGVLGPVAVWGAAGAVRVLGRGVVHAPAPGSARGAPRGSEEAVRVTALSRRAAAAAGSLAEVASRIPGDDARVRVERHVFADGSQQFAAYVGGTAGGLGPDPGEAWDMRSNLELYGGRTSASQQAVERALADAGARLGDTVHLYGFSQGAMIAGRMAIEGRYDVRTLVTFGAPTAVMAGASTLNVTMRYRDDPVVALAGGGAPVANGSPQSFVAEAVREPLAWPGDVTMPAHRMDAYVDLAAQVDASGDPRVAAARERHLDALAGAREIVATEYAAERVSDARE